MISPFIKLVKASPVTAYASSRRKRIHARRSECTSMETDNEGTSDIQKLNSMLSSLPQGTESISATRSKSVSLENFYYLDGTEVENQMRLHLRDLEKKQALTELSKLPVVNGAPEVRLDGNELYMSIEDAGQLYASVSPTTTIPRGPQEKPVEVDYKDASKSQMQTEENAMIASLSELKELLCEALDSEENQTGSGSAGTPQGKDSLDGPQSSGAVYAVPFSQSRALPALPETATMEQGGTSGQEKNEVGVLKETSREVNPLKESHGSTSKLQVSQDPECSKETVVNEEEYVTVAGLDITPADEGGDMYEVMSSPLSGSRRGSQTLHDSHWSTKQQDACNPDATYEAIATPLSPSIRGSQTLHSSTGGSQTLHDSYRSLKVQDEYVAFNPEATYEVLATPLTPSIRGSQTLHSSTGGSQALQASYQSLKEQDEYVALNPQATYNEALVTPLSARRGSSGSTKGMFRQRNHSLSFHQLSLSATPGNDTYEELRSPRKQISKKGMLKKSQIRIQATALPPRPATQATEKKEFSVSKGSLDAPLSIKQQEDIYDTVGPGKGLNAEPALPYSTESLQRSKKKGTVPQKESHLMNFPMKRTYSMPSTTAPSKPVRSSGDEDQYMPMASVLAEIPTLPLKEDSGKATNKFESDPKQAL